MNKKQANDSKMPIYTLREWQQKTFDVYDLIWNASVIDGTDSWTPFPIGISHHMFPLVLKNKGFLKTQHTQLFHVSFLLYTDQDRRKEGINRRAINDILEKKGIHNFHYSPVLFYKSISNSKYVIAPEGNGIDSHRTYEALLAGCVPILEDNPLTREKYRGLPILYTTDYRDINPATLEAKWTEMLDMSYDYSKLFVSSYTPEIQDEIRRNGNFWLKKLGACLFDFYPTTPRQ